MPKSFVHHDWCSLYQMGVAYLRWKDYKAATLCFEIALSKHESAHLYGLLGSCYFFLDERIKAEHMFQQGMKKYPKAADIPFHYASMKVDERAFNDALVLFGRCLEINPQHELSLKAIEYCLRELGKNASP